MAKANKSKKELQRGVVAARIHQHCQVYAGGEVQKCLVPENGKLAERDALIPGDIVEIKEDEGHRCQVVKVHARSSCYFRSDPRAPEQTVPIAANVQSVLIVLCANNLDEQLGWAIPALIAARRAAIVPVICLSKADLVEGKNGETLEAVRKKYEERGIRVVICSVWSGEGIEELAALAHDQTSVVIGQPGVGKTSLILAILARLGDKPPVSTSIPKLLAEGDTIFIDTPGIRQFALSDMTEAEQSWADLAPGDASPSSPDYRFESCQESFTCQKCGSLVEPEGAGTQHRNHCPQCLSSVHVDNQPGDRAASCGGTMEAISVWVRHDGEWALIHRCRDCGALSSNRIAADDNPLLLMSLAARPLSNPPFPLEYLESMAKSLVERK